MKYNVRVTGLLVGLFLLAQLVGLAVLYQDIVAVVPTPGGGVEIVHPDTAIGERPEVEGPDSVLLILFGVFIGTVLLLLIIRYASVAYWKILFFLAVWSTISVSLGVLIPADLALPAFSGLAETVPVNFLVAIGLALLLAIVKLARPNILIHNLTELLIYAGIAVVFVPLLTVEWAILLLLVISAYDAFAVWQSRHMVTLAKYQVKSRVFAGLLISEGRPAAKDAAPAKGRRAAQAPAAQEAILGGGDVAFPLIFAGVVMESLVLAGVAKPIAYLQTLIIPVILAAVVLLLLIKGEQGKFYPAMPFLTAGCLLGWAAVLLLG
ncbi:MAG: hypothetical protein HY369_04145 [Candidatus Aenigmarchaeota archaeon]|nr:hypothetical protein [Candidatus Aenigmarchaeota archaeon]